MVGPVPVVAASSIDQRFAQLIQQFGLTKNSFAISLGKTASVVQHLIDGRNKPGFDLMCKVFEVYPNVSRDWLLLGRGPMLVGSNGSGFPAAAAAAVPEPKPLEPDFEPIDLADVAPRATRRASTTRLHPEEIAATLALANAAADAGAVTTSAPLPAAASNVVSAAPAPSVAAPQPVSNPDTALAVGHTPPVSAPVARRFVRPYRPTPGPVAAVPEPVPQPEAAPIAQEPTASAESRGSAPVGEAIGNLPTPPPMGGAEAYVAAAIHAQHLQHQLALAELRNQHLLEQQQMLREMLAMARQSMV